MTDDLYRCLCDTCDVSEFREGLASAQAFFNDHADDGCEVFIRKVASPDESTSVDPTDADPTDDDPGTGSESVEE